MIKIEAFCTKNNDIDQTDLNTGLKTQNVEELSLDLIFQNILSVQRFQAFFQKKIKLKHKKQNRLDRVLIFYVSSFTYDFSIYSNIYVQYFFRLKMVSP